MQDRSVNRRRMETLVERWRRSGQPLTVFARAEGMTRGTLEYWRRRVGAPSRRERPAGVDRVSFAPVHLLPQRTSGGSLEVALPDGTRVTVNEGIPTEFALAIIEALRRPC